MKQSVRTCQLDNVIWTDFRPLYRTSALARPAGRARHRAIGRAVSRRSICAPQDVLRICPEGLSEQDERVVLHVLGVARLPLVNRRLRQRVRRTHRNE